MALIPRHFNLVVLNEVLLDDGLASAKSAGLLDGSRVEVSLGDEAIVAGDVRGGFRGANRELVVFICLFTAISRQFVARLVPVGAKGHLELSLEVATLRRVCLAWVRPERAL